MTESEKVVVTGGSGFVASHLADSLSRSGRQVTIFDQAPSPWLRNDQVMVVGDIMDTALLRETFRGAKYVYHMAGIADIHDASERPMDTIRSNVVGSLSVMEACVAEKVERLLIASTVYVYSDKGSFYRVSKQSVEMLIEAYQEKFGLAYTVLRYGSLYGPRAQTWNGIKHFIHQAISDGKIVCQGSGEELREYIHVQDAAELSVQALEPRFANRCLTLTGTQVLSLRQVLTMIGEIYGKRVQIEFSGEDSAFRSMHYKLTPYRYTPRQGVKVVPNVFIDIGQGILEMIAEVDNECNGTSNREC